MSTLVSELIESLGPKVSLELSRQLGLQPQVAENVLPTIAPIILSGLKRQLREKADAGISEELLNAFGGTLGVQDAGQLIQKQLHGSDAESLTERLLGNEKQQAVNALGKKLGLDSGTVMKLIPVIAPIVIGFLAQKTGGQGLSGLTGLLDRDGDGSILDDVTGFLGGSLSGGGDASEKKSSPGGLLAGLLGGFLGKRRR